MAITFFSCNKEGDEPLPVIQFLTPSSNSQFSVGDTIMVRAIITDEQMIRTVSVHIVNADFIPVTNLISINVDDAEYELNIPLVIDNEDIISGEHYIRVIATDKHNYKVKFQSIFISGIEKVTIGYIAITRKSVSVSAIHLLNRGFSFDSVFDITSDYLLSEVNPTAGQFYYVTPNPSKIIALDAMGFEEQWSTVASPPHAEFTATDVMGHLYIASANGNIWGYTAQGFTPFITNGWNEYIPDQIAVNPDFLLAEQEARSGLNRFIVAYYTTSGYETNKLLVSDDITGISRAGDAFLISAWDGLNTTISLLEPEEMTFTPLKYVEGVRYKGIERVDDHSFLLYSDEQVSRFDLTFNMLVPLFPTSVSDIVFDELAHYIFVVNEYGVEVYEYPYGSYATTIVFDKPVLGFHVLYNK
jgi:hypothetical protein